MADDLEDDQWLYGETPDLNNAPEGQIIENEPLPSEENVQEPPPAEQEVILLFFGLSNIT